MLRRTVETDVERLLAVNLIGEQAMPFTIEITEGKARSKAQNRLQWVWMAEIAKHFGHQNIDEAQAFCKLHYGVPILRRDDDEYREKYDKFIKPHSYEDKLSLMRDPVSWPVTRLFTKPQIDEYFLTMAADQSSKHGLVLSQPEQTNER